MHTKLLLPVLTAMTLAAASTAALAGALQSDLRGKAVPAQAAVDQVIVITEATRHINVTGGSTVRFVVGERSFSWNFQNGSAHVVPFDLQAIAPEGLLNHPVTAYVSDNPLYQNN
jgi:type IV pilus biogenesis protein CpaD/CtpE